MKPHRIKKCIRALNKAILNTQKKLYGSIVANDRRKEEKLWGTLDELVRRRVILTHRFLNQREDNQAAEEAGGASFSNPAPACNVSSEGLHA